jgi:gliding motility-associated-like protein
LVLSVKNSFGCKQILEKPKLIIASGPINANFSFNYANSCQPPTPVTFTNSSSPAPLSYQWSFGDGHTSTLSSPAYTYDSTGDYQVKLVSTNVQGCADTIIQKISIGTVRPDFTFNNTCIHQIVSFVNTSSPSPLSVQWSFGDSSTATTINATHQYAISKSYQVTMIADFGSCKVSKTKNIIITTKPSLAFTATGSVAQCAVPATVQFNNTTTGATAYQWLFGDSTTAFGTNPSHGYNKSGNFDVTLIASSIGGCSDTLTHKKLINLGPPKITSIQNLPYIGCVGDNIKMTPVIISPETIASYAWDFGDGSISTVPVPSHGYFTQGNYIVTLKVTTTGGCTAIFTSSASVSTVPVAKFIQDPSNVCASVPIQFTDQSTGTISSWLWDFGDNTTSALQNPSHNFADTGKFVVTLTVSNNSCKSFYNGDTLYIHPPIAAFKVTNQCQFRFIKVFTDASIGALTRIWDFGDGQTDTIPNPQHTYANAGIYTVTLFVTNGSCSSKSTKTINVINQNPSYTYTPVSPIFCKYSSVQFQAINYDTSLVNSFYWDFGDKTSAPFSRTDSVISHQYNSSGIFPPIMIARDILGCKDTVSGLVAFTVFGPKAAFSPNVAGTCVKTMVPFTDKSTTDGTHNIVNWIWDYGDGKSDTLTSAPFQHTYGYADTFTIRLKVIDSYGCSDTLTRKKILIITQPLANFSISDSLRCTNNNITFTNSSTGGAFANSWDFGDGNTSATKSPIYTYANEGIYTVKLTITDQFGCTDSIIKPNILTISNPVASFNLTDTFATCPPLVIQPLNTSRNYQAGSELWQFDDGNTSSLFNPVHTFTNGGTYQLTLMVRGYGQCYDTASKTVLLHGSSGILSYPHFAGCQPATVTVSAAIKNSLYRTWDFGDGVVVTNTDSSITHTYTSYGLYRPKLLLSDTSGCLLTVLNKDTIHVSGIRAGFSSIQQTDCDSSFIDFMDSSRAYYDTLSTYSWSLGDNSGVSSLPNLRYHYLHSGNYPVSHAVQSLQGCKDTLTTLLAIAVHTSPKLVINTIDSACMPSPIQFYVKDTAVIYSPITSWQWDFGDGGTDVVQQPLYAFPVSGSFNVQVAGTNSDGCTGIASHDVILLPAPLTDAGLDTTLCLGQSITLRPTGANSYVWSSQPSLSCNQCANPVARPNLPTRYYVTGTSLGCHTTDSILVQVKMPFILTLSPPDTLCIGQSVQLHATGGDAYQWIPAVGLSNSAIANPVANPSATTTYTLVATDNKNCFTDTGKLMVSVFPMPIFNIIDTNITLIAGYSKPIRTTGSEDIVRWEWSPSTGLDCSNCAEPVTQPGSNMVYTARAYTNAGCMASDHVTVNVFCTGSNVFIPNTFSPNGNGMNERFYPRGIGLFDIPLFQVFNRYGLVVFEKHGMTPNAASDGWDGTYKGQPAPTGVYVYVMEVTCINNTVFKFKGNVTLIR